MSSEPFECSTHTHTHTHTRFWQRWEAAQGQLPGFDGWPSCLKVETVHRLGLNSCVVKMTPGNFFLTKVLIPVKDWALSQCQNIASSAVVPQNTRSRLIMSITLTVSCVMSSPVQRIREHGRDEKPYLGRHCLWEVIYFMWKEQGAQHSALRGAGVSWFRLGWWSLSLWQPALCILLRSSGTRSAEGQLCP